jgi:hypothetical protein
MPLRYRNSVLKSDIGFKCIKEFQGYVHAFLSAVSIAGIKGHNAGSC